MNRPHSEAGPDSAGARLLQSRRRLRQALHGDPASGAEAAQYPPRAPSASAGPTVAAPTAARATADPTDTPAARVLLTALSAWWAGHPLHLAGTLALQTADAAVRPVAHKHPVALMAAGLATGALLAWVRPWRHLSGKAVAAVVVPALLPRLLPSLMPSLIPSLASSLLARPGARAQPELWPHLLRAFVAATQTPSAADHTSQPASKKA